ncbi:MAG: hypothetical protein UHY90_07880 [Treponema sp.]|nr:hypothetical protein [Spirochaetia bacterium]MDD7460825.1 hypothetical protein [Spirochaetales bacterium]MDY5812868.1 hypothetical protein [Treponema sp.]MEE1182158.1 hypothetical protein [Treponema sp.]
MDELLTLNDDKAMEVQKYRVEIICSQALEEDFDEEFKTNNVAKMFTKVDNVKGAGYSNPHLGDAVWPQLNTMYIIYCNKEDADKIAAIVLKLRKLYRTEGIGCFVSQSNELYSM